MNRMPADKPHNRICPRMGKIQEKGYHISSKVGNTDGLVFNSKLFTHNPKNSKTITPEQITYQLSAVEYFSHSSGGVN